MINYDVERVTQVLSDLEPFCIDDELDGPAVSPPHSQSFLS